MANAPRPVPATYTAYFETQIFEEHCKNRLVLHR